MESGYQTLDKGLMAALNTRRVAEGATMSHQRVAREEDCIEELMNELRRFIDMSDSGRSNEEPGAVAVKTEGALEYERQVTAKSIPEHTLCELVPLEAVPRDRNAAHECLNIARDVSAAGRPGELLSAEESHERRSDVQCSQDLMEKLQMDLLSDVPKDVQRKTENTMYQYAWTGM